MKYRVLFTKTAAKDIQKLDFIIQKRIKKALEKYSSSPFTYAKKMIDSRLGSYRWRMGNYRVVFDIKENTIIILRAGHRREVYR